MELGSDCWQMGMLIFACLTARFPWERADIVDPRFREFIEWQKRKTVKTPKEFRRFTPRLMRLFRRWMEQKPTKRYPITEINKYLKDRWLMRGSPRASSVIKLNVPEVGACWFISSSTLSISIDHPILSYPIHVDRLIIMVGAWDLRLVLVSHEANHAASSTRKPPLHHNNHSPITPPSEPEPLHGSMLLVIVSPHPLFHPL